MNADGHRSAATDTDVTEQIIGCAFAASNTLGVGFLEKVYENARVLEIPSIGLPVHQQAPITVRYRGQGVGDYVADLIVNPTALIKLKHTAGLDKTHMAQCLNYLRIIRLKTCLLLNFRKPKIETQRLSL